MSHDDEAAWLLQLQAPTATGRVSAAKQLGELGSAAAIPPLVAALHDAEESVGSAVGDALIRLGQRGLQIAPALREALQHPDPARRLAVVRLLARIGNRSVVSLLLLAARDANEGVRGAAWQALTRIKQPAREEAEDSRTFPRSVAGGTTRGLVDSAEHEKSSRFDSLERGTTRGIPGDEEDELESLSFSTPGASAEPAAVVPPPTTDMLSFTLVAPARLARGLASVLTVYAHLAAQREEVMKRARSLAAVDVRFQEKAGVKVARGTTLTLRLQIDGLEVSDPEDEITWDGEIGNATFPISVPAEAATGTYAGKITIHAGDVRISKLNFVLDVGDQTAPAVSVPVTESRHRTAFASYASEDRSEVLARVHGMQKAAPDLDVFVDILTLRSGQQWLPRLQEEIAKRDVFYLFWSPAAQRSEWVEKEWRSALELRGLDYIDPVPLAPPDQVRPPEELGALHFNDWILAFIRK